MNSIYMQKIIKMGENEYMNLTCVDIKQNFVRALKNNYDLIEEKEIMGEVYDVIGHYYERTSKYMITKKAEIYAFRNYEKLFLKNIEEIDGAMLAKLREEIDRNIHSIVEVDDEHMSTDISFVFVTKNIDSETVKSIKKFKYYRGFKFGFKGWVNVKLFVYSTETEELYSNWYGRRSNKDIKRVINLE